MSTQHGLQIQDVEECLRIGFDDEKTEVCEDKS